MSERIDIYLYTYLEINKDDHICGVMRFFEPETTLVKNAYFDNGGCIPSPSPVIADYDGRFPKLFIDKPYRVVIEDRHGVQIFCDDYE